MAHIKADPCFQQGNVLENEHFVSNKRRLQVFLGKKYVRSYFANQ